MDVVKCMDKSFAEIQVTAGIVLYGDSDTTECGRLLLISVQIVNILLIRCLLVVLTYITFIYVYFTQKTVLYNKFFQYICSVIQESSSTLLIDLDDEKNLILR